MADTKKNDRALRDLKNAIAHSNIAAIENALKRLNDDEFIRWTVSHGVSTQSFVNLPRAEQIVRFANHLVQGRMPSNRNLDVAAARQARNTRELLLAVDKLDDTALEEYAMASGAAVFPGELIRFREMTRSKRIQHVVDHVISYDKERAEQEPWTPSGAVSGGNPRPEFLAMARMVRALLTVDLEDVRTMMQTLPTNHRHHVCETLGIENHREMNDQSMADAVVNWAKNQHTLFGETRKLQEETNILRKDFEELKAGRAELEEAYKNSLVSKDQTIRVLTHTLALIYEGADE